ncbi:MAG: hypothetical protein A2Z24_01625 [Candidatus Woykebacteria bacterium RBG_16_44_10]|uniref:Uncharacterized protein n=1 Tax=Candidatus Woykebacteria bacterium RBG_16_44_10 TaxID=1802597 RepID=A0A1G1WEW0_9BACT|nr:MAG: hypothetical protein A2Z24_01625 [Candidatus Woykebacteria bacterium RBG_16_44_10]
MTENIRDFISFHNARILNPELTATFEIISLFAAKKNIALEDLSIEKHRLPFINWCTSLNSTQI